MAGANFGFCFCNFCVNTKLFPSKQWNKSDSFWLPSFQELFLITRDSLGSYTKHMDKSSVVLSSACLTPVHFDTEIPWKRWTWIISPWSARCDSLMSAIFTGDSLIFSPQGGRLNHRKSLHHFQAPTSNFGKLWKHRLAREQTALLQGPSTKCTMQTKHFILESNKEDKLTLLQF